MDTETVNAALTAFPAAGVIHIFKAGAFSGSVVRDCGGGAAVFDVYGDLPRIHSCDWRDHIIMGTGRVVDAPVVEVRGNLYVVDDRAEIGAVW